MYKKSREDGGNDVLLLENGSEHYGTSDVIASREINPAETVRFLCSLFSESIHIIHYSQFAVFRRDWFLGYLKMPFQPCRLYSVQYQQGWNLNDQECCYANALRKYRGSNTSRYTDYPDCRGSSESFLTNSVISSITPRSCPSRPFAIHHNRISDTM